MDLIVLKNLEALTYYQLKSRHLKRADKSADSQLKATRSIDKQFKKLRLFHHNVLCMIQHNSHEN